MINEENFLEKFAKLDEEAIIFFVNNYKPQICRIIKTEMRTHNIKFTNKHNDEFISRIESCFNEVFESLLAALGDKDRPVPLSFKEASHLLGYVKQMIVNELNEKHREERKARREKGYNEIESIVDHRQPCVNDAYQSRDVMEIVYKHIKNNVDSSIVRMRYEDKLTFAQIGARLGTSEGAARAKHQRIIGRLRSIGVLFDE